MTDSARAEPDSWSVCVPASTSNLGPGFDLLGLAVDLFLRVRVQRVEGPPKLVLRSKQEFAATWPDDSSNLLLGAFEQVQRDWGALRARFEFDVSSEIPVSRGLGSSGAAVVAGIALACAALDRPLAANEQLRRALAVEGHPDNVAPALLGGCVAAVPAHGGPPWLVRQALHESLVYAVAWPDATLETKTARALLPAHVSFADARENPRRLALLLEGLRSGDPELLRAGAADRLHVRYRLPHIPGGAEALDAAYAAGAALATISGSGTALFAIASHERVAAVAQAMRAAFERSTGSAGGRVVQAVHDAVRATAN